MADRTRLFGILSRLGVVFAITAVATVGWSGVRAWESWRNVDRLAFDTAEARDDLDAQRPPTTTSPIPNPSGDTENDPNPFDEVLAALIVGSDQLEETGLSRRADAILMFVIPPGGDPLLFSIPRDLWIENPCTGGMSRINANLNGCGTHATGPEQLAIAVEDFTGIAVDHFAVLDFDGFKAIIDRTGGIEICIEHQVRDDKSLLSLPAGCTEATGEQALAWVRSRSTFELVDGVWRRMAVNDLTRNQRQQDVVLQALVRLKSFRSIADLSAMVDDLAGAFVIDDGLSLRDAVSIAWSLRALEVDRIVRLVIPTYGYLTSNEPPESVLRPSEPFSETLRRDYPYAHLIIG